jgi:hypothetical protein
LSGAGVSKISPDAPYFIQILYFGIEKNSWPGICNLFEIRKYQLEDLRFIALLFFNILRDSRGFFIEDHFVEAQQDPKVEISLKPVLLSLIWFTLPPNIPLMTSSRGFSSFGIGRSYILSFVNFDFNSLFEFTLLGLIPWTRVILLESLGQS